MNIWVGCLAAYNAGCLHGEWFDLADFAELEELTEAIGEKVIKSSPESGAEEWAIFDTDEVPSSLSNGMYPDLGAIWEYWESVQDLEDSEVEPFAAFFDYHGDSPDVERFREAYCGECRDMTEWAEELCENTGMLDSIPENLQGYFDFEKFGRDLELGGDYIAIDSDSGIFVFHGGY